MSDRKYEVIKQDQELLFSSIQKIANRVQSAINPPRQLLLGRLSNLQDFWEKCRVNHVQLTATTQSATEIDETIDMYDPDKFFEIEETYEDAVDFILSKLPDQPIIQRASDRSPSGDHSTATNARSSTSSVHLPRINIPTFSGSYSEWLSFRDLFTSLIINNNCISDAERLHYLKLSLKDEALIIAQNQPGNADDFKLIWQNLESRYNNSKALIFDYLKRITDFPDITVDFLNNLKSLRNLIITVTTALKNLQRPIDEGNDLFIFILINKLDKLSRDQWELLVSDTTDPPSLDQFNKFLDSRIRALEASAATKKRKHHRNVCESKNVCSVCKKQHHSLLHRDQNVNTASLKELKLKESDYTQDASSSQNKSETESFKLSNHLNATEKRTAVLLATARVIVEAADGRRVQVRALLDQGSEASFVSESVVQLLRLPRKSSNVSVSGLGGNFSKKVLFSVPLVVKPVKSGSELFTTRAFVLPKITSYIPTEFALANIPPNLRDLEFADPCPWSTEPIDLLIGADLYGKTLCTNFSAGSLSVPVQVTLTQSHHVNVHLCINEIDNNLRRFWELEEIPSNPILTKAERECETYFSETTERLPSGRFQVKLPFNQPPTVLGDSLKIATASLNNDSNSQKVFIPHHCVMRELSQTTKLRVVLNASSPTANGISLNDCLHIGPKLLNDILSILLRWRQHQFVFCADIANMFRQILVSPEDRKYQCILWRDSPDLPLQVYELNTVTYGMRSSPYLANRVMRQLALDEQKRFPIAACVLYNDTYVDDTFVGGSDKPSTIKLRDNLIELTKLGGFPLRKWCSNDSDLLQDLSEMEHGIAVEIPLGESLGFKVLGIFWEPSTDAFIYRFSKLSSENPSKRTLLSAVASLFDPMGWISPVTITVKILLQKLWLRKLDWDDELPSDLAHEWREFCEKLPCLSQVSIPRWLTTNNNLTSIQIHGFSDASSIAYGAAVYCRVIDSSKNISVKLLIAKTRVAPLKTVSIPRLELLAATLLSTLIKFVIKSLKFIDVPIFCWTDSTIVLSWLQKQPSTWTLFVANRVSSIQTDLPTAV
ncbi:uncharacterized protein LOC122500432 [Leptopilina heterotoma]|uniref:uncharacterized protein LOC122500432 n=1 Tax=Leptopilina heterotoma TaxID=63436 RepID=UPI001CA9B580|nr:uncharacterized protein LOC122500432 [Leptopilina heterotoma]